ncbi:MAG: 4-hydroxythreonine-4-phosphate dehydrogenase PdxA, partial [Methylophaga sp.]|nr:4-hydroxythreonine-4-phosphate dehydrogenase PdxA [Methylophaga sp.]
MIKPQRLAVTAGEPAGIGPDLLIMLSQVNFAHELVVIADPDLLVARAMQLGINVELQQVDFSQPPVASQVGQICYLPVKLAAKVVPGKLNPANANYVLESLALAAEGCLQGQFAAVVTAPVHKGVINDAGMAFSGHT